MLEPIQGTKVTIYADPFTRNVPEEQAEAIRRVAGGNTFHDENGRPYVMERWLVRFDDGEVRERKIRRDYVEA